MEDIATRQETRGRSRRPETPEVPYIHVVRVYRLSLRSVEIFQSAGGQGC